MKRLISAVLALSLLGTAAASAQPFGGGEGGYDRGVQRDYRDNGASQNRYDGNRGNYDRGYQRDNGWSQDRYDGNRGNYGNYDRGYQRDNGWSQNRYTYGDNYNRGYQRNYGGGNWNRGHNDNAALVGLGIGLFALGALAASHHGSDHGYQNNGGYGYGR